MATPTKETPEKEDREFGLPKAEFKPIAARGKQWRKITAVIVGIVLSIGVGVVYWFFYHAPAVDPSQKISAILEERKNSALTSDTDTIHKNTDIDSLTKKQEGLKVAATTKGESKNSSTAYATLPHKEGAITHSNAPQGYYYIILGSFIDEDLASDYAHALAKKGTDVTLIPPPSKQHYYWVAIKQGKIFSTAYKTAEKLKSVYGTDIWVMKY
ncbi:MAG: SPOR domain-containing protein [Bacteroidota bacterium]